MGRYTYIFVGKFKKLDDDGIAAVHLTTLHELTHHYDRDPKPEKTDDSYHHDKNVPIIVPAGNASCMMNPTSKINTPSRLFGWRKYHLYAVRDQLELKMDGK